MNKVLCVGMFKTGTTTMNKVFRILGYKTSPGNWGSILKGETDDFGYYNNWESKTDCWGHVLEEIKDESKKYEAYEDSPWLFMYPHIDKWYKGTKFILTVRKDNNTLVRSQMKDYISYCKSTGANPKTNIPPVDKIVRRYEIHNKNVIDYFKNRPKDLLIVCFDYKDGWNKICDFLNKPVPNVPFPHLNIGTNKG